VRLGVPEPGVPEPAPLTAANQQWAIDFVHDVTATGRKFRIFSVMDATRASVWRWKWTLRFLRAA